YFNRAKDRFFPRSPAVIGRDVRNCHPPESLHIVEEIVNKFRNDERDNAEFWITLRGKFIHIRYFAVRDEKGGYKGVLEVSQDVTDIRELQGQKRLLDWS
ncbi:MAG: PAS domain-containing protein, partial [Bacteroidales bacterium]|nr:PAS domain-containing protein [Bacteroidales bacterium]